LEDLEHALMHREGEVQLLVEVHYALMRVCLDDADHYERLSKKAKRATQVCLPRCPFFQFVTNVRLNLVYAVKVGIACQGRVTVASRVLSSRGLLDLIEQRILQVEVSMAAWILFFWESHLMIL
jgi:hypothetical protein